MSENLTTGTVVVGYDGSTSARHALDWAVDQAVAEHRPLTVVYAAPPSEAMWLDQAGYDQRLGVKALMTHGQSLLEEARELAERRAPGLEVRELLRAADPRDVLIEASQSAATVVLGSRGRGTVKSLLLGSVSLAVSRHAGCPVVVHRPGNAGVVRHGILAGIDTTESSLPVLEYAFRIASQRHLPLTVIHAYFQVPVAAPPGYLIGVREIDPEDEKVALAECMAGLREKYPDVHVSTELPRGLADVALVERGERMNLLVVGAHHGGAVSAVVFGSVAGSVVEHATCPVAIVPTR